MDILSHMLSKKYIDKKIDEAGSPSNEQVSSAVNDYLMNNPVMIDKTLTVNGMASDAKTTGNRLLNIEYQTVTTKEAYEHTDLPEGEKTVTINSDGSWGDVAYICTGEDLVPRGSFNQTFPYNGVTLTRENNIYHLTGTATVQSSMIYFGDANNNFKIDSVKNMIGQTLKLVTFADKPLGSNVRIYISFRDENETELLAHKKPIASTTTSNVSEVVVPDNTAYMQVSIILLKDYAFDNKIQLYLSLTDNFQTVNDFNNTITEENTITTLPYPSIVSTRLALPEYIQYVVDNNDNNIVIPEGSGIVTYLTPEDFGAVGNGVTDDSEAIAECLKRAASSNGMVLMARKYYVSAPIEIANNLNIIANRIIYDGTDTAVKIYGKRNTIKIYSISSSGVGMTIGGESATGTVIYNNIDVCSITAEKHGIVFDSSTASIFQNTIRFNIIRAGGTGFHGIAFFNSQDEAIALDENNFYGGQITNCEWAVYRAQGNSRFYGIQIEGNVQGGFYVIEGCTIFHPRIAESMRDGNLPIYKFIDPRFTTIYDSSRIAINQIDLSEAVELDGSESGNTYQVSEGSFGRIYGSIIGSNIEDGQYSGVSCVYSTLTYLWGKHLIFTPFMSYRKVITTPELDTRNIGKETDFADIRSLSQLPTKFVVDSVNSDIYLHPSYCAFGINEFEVEQLNGFNCRVHGTKKTKDDGGNFVEETFVIFDGTTRGDGCYKFKVYKDASLCSSGGLLHTDFLGHYWQVTKSGDTVI